MLKKLPLFCTFLLVCFNANYAMLSASAKSIENYKNEPIQPIPLSIDLDENKVNLGRRLFNDSILSHDNLISCSNCHQLEKGGDDGLPVSITNKGENDLINAPTVFNSVYNFRHTWSGEFKTLEMQAESVLKNPRHGAIEWQELLPKLKHDKDYKKMFADIYEAGITRETVLESIAVFEKSLITPNSRFDKYLRGDSEAINKDEKLGYKYFKEYGCIACHQGVNVGGNVFQKLGLFGNYFENRGDIKQADYGRYNVTNKEKDRFVFRVPSLRNVAVTAPYLHDGRIESLRGAIEIMARYQLGTTIKMEHINKIEMFLHSLTGEYDGRSLEGSN